MNHMFQEVTMKAKGSGKERAKEKQMIEQDSMELTDEKIRRAGKMIERHMGYGRYELNIFELVYCHALDKFVDHSACHSCRGDHGNYADSWHQQMCGKAEHDPPHMLSSRAWTLGELMITLQNERDRVRKQVEQEMKDREEFGPIHVETEEEIRERERFARALSHVSFEDMHKPFTI